MWYAGQASPLNRRFDSPAHALHGGWDYYALLILRDTH